MGISLQAIPGDIINYISEMLAFTFIDDDIINNVYLTA